ncbi:uracil-DNA glycosylase [Meira miltonrushii]|uniref:Uracil-DNA glycosylase n=1 Tax=Meira miltonrushii TaxID=1280837 RepID=A0A316VK98_9BASI|nr:uracil-DNA glycosylase [Meira miltonrushii]PWN38012.1 uracil-DNA glycosylase [Meira miltonrushii]
MLSRFKPLHTITLRVQSIKPPLHTLRIAHPTNTSYSLIQLSTMSTSAKRSAPSSPSKAEKVIKKVAREPEFVEDEFGDDGEFDAEALLDATMAAEKDEEIRVRSSQASSTTTPSKANGAANSQTNGIASSQTSIPSKSPASTPSKQPTSSLSTTSAYLTHGDPRVEKETMDPEWYERLSGEMEKDYFKKLKHFLQGEVQSKKTIYPPAQLIHSWSRLTPLSTVKVVVVGQDPYHGQNQACGHSFSVPKGIAVPGSLKNIYKELVEEYGSGFVPPKHGCLDGWAKQGVLLLNACLTVEAHKAGSHHNKGWEPFTQTILRAIAEDAAKGPKASVKTSTIANMFGKAAEKQGVKPAIVTPSSSNTAKSSSDDSSQSSSSKGVVFLAWGLPAAKTLAEAGITEKSSNILLLKSPHPSPLSAHRGFLGNGHFKKANEWLESESRYGSGGGIDWTKL